MAVVCNILAMLRLEQADYKMCLDLLKRAEGFTPVQNQRMQAITYNNYACLFRKTGKLRNALSYLEKALDFEY